MLADRRAVYDGLGLPLADGLAVEARGAGATFADAAAGRGALRRGRGPRRGRRGGMRPRHRHRLTADSGRKGPLLSYYVTGATGFIGRHLVEELLRNREGDVHVLVREDSRDKLDALIARWPDAERVKPVVGDLQQRNLGHDDAWVEEHRGRIEHFFHLAAIYDMTAPTSSTSA